MKKSIATLLSVLFACTILTSCNTNKAIKGTIEVLKKTFQKKDTLKKTVRNSPEEKTFEKEWLAGRVINNATRKESDSIHAGELLKMPDSQEINQFELLNKAEEK
jgi:outer membrane PBP1 activator LpoA protein